MLLPSSLSETFSATADSPPDYTLATEKRTARRSREEKDGRDFQCGCGKSYLSYQALYIHVNLKHDRISPLGTTNLQQGLVPMAGRKRGKPKKNFVILPDEVLKCEQEQLSAVTLAPFCQPAENDNGSGEPEAEKSYFDPMVWYDALQPTENCPISEKIFEMTQTLLEKTPSDDFSASMSTHFVRNSTGNDLKKLSIDQVIALYAIDTGEVV